MDNDLERWFEERLAGLPPVELSADERRIGTDALTHPEHRELVNEAVRTWMRDRFELLDYGQVCRAFFGAALKLKAMAI